MNTLRKVAALHKFGLIAGAAYHINRDVVRIYNHRGTPMLDVSGTDLYRHHQQLKHLIPQPTGLGIVVPDNQLLL